MNYLYAIILGLVQGIAEFLPISSSGHLALFETVLGADTLAALDGSACFNVLLHLATLAAVVIAYWSDVRDMLTECGGIVGDLRRRRSLVSGNVPARRLILMIILSTLPLFVFVPFHHAIERLSTIPWFIGAALLLTGCLLYISDRLPRGEKTEKTMTVKDALLVGLAQCAALIPGLSRSGTTITAGMGCGFSREFAVRFSFLMSLLSVLGSVALKALDMLGEPLDTTLLLPYLVGMAVAFVTGYYSIKLLNRLVSKGKFGGFAYYCWGVGALAIVISVVVNKG